ncbi:MAG: serine/threonine protein kinase [Deltaproteobacteria bacterium]|nr:serine/threonine protein kinase [Deltaproteobacteria bacterium]MBK8240583.1 serine/threonine protein kinase [Deltaproteobacteria bacterium]MBK8718136.1 serine/threonine protein kinase [Deltaproteobacteria bacterium]MBP7288455.1 serine/threonine protein kinase [Nannocystaceae bacterium]
MADTRTEEPTTGPARADTVPAASSAEPAPAAIGRYVVTGKLGAGGMGVVYRAFDPQLQRTVAIKLVRPRRARDPAAAEHHARLLREARALAALSHPNVVPVFDVGEHDGGMFVAMQLIEGDNMQRWLAREQPPWRRILGVFRAAGRGLAAAHTAGLVHRDFKPANVLVGDDGRVRVVDFGLARAALGEDERAEGRLDPELFGSVTQVGVLVGTPLYMAPEQFVGGAADARADQYAFCVAFFEALYGHAPFVGPELRPMLAAKRRGQVPPRPAHGRGADVPQALHDVIARGLQPDPARRFGNMPDLLRELRRISEANTAEDSEASSRRRGLLLFLVVALVAVVVFVARCATNG